MERICGHGIGHLDPDELKGPVRDAYEQGHGCDGCCNPASQFSKDAQELTKQYVKPDYLTPTSVGPVSTGLEMEVTPMSMFDDILIKLNALTIRKGASEE